MKKLTILYIAILFPFIIFAPGAFDVSFNRINTLDQFFVQAQSSDFNITIDGQIVNKLGETSASTKNILVQYIRNNQVKGEDLTSSTGSFTIGGVVTGINELYVPENKIVVTGSVVFSNQTTFEIQITEPGRVIATSITGAIEEIFDLPNTGKYKFSFDGKSSIGIHIITVQTNSWSESIKLVSTGNSETDGLKLQSFEPINYEYGLKSAEQDTLKISGENISTTLTGFWHERDDVNVGQKYVNQGVEITGTPAIQNTETGKEVSIDLNNYVYNDDQCSFVPGNTNFKMVGSILYFSSDTTGTFITVVDVIDGEDPNLSKEMDVQIIVTEEADVIKPEFNEIILNGNEDEPISYNLNNGATDNKTVSENIIWDISNGQFTNTTINDRTVTFIPTKDYNGKDKVTATITDEVGNIATQELIIDYTAVPDAPIANDDVDETMFNTSKTTQVLNNDTDVENDIVPNITEIITQPSNGNVSVNIDGSINYTPNTGFEGKDFYNYSITDATGLKDTANVTITTSANPNIAPVLSVIPNDNTNEDTPKIGPLLDDYVTDDFTIDENIQWSVSSSDESKLKVLVNADRKVEFTPQLNQFGIVNVTYTVKDEGELEKSITQEFTINPVNDVPILNPISNVNL